MRILRGTWAHWGRKAVEGGSEDWLQIAQTVVHFILMVHLTEG